MANRIVLSLVPVAALGVVAAGASDGRAPRPDIATLLVRTHVTDYLRWTRVNPRPVIMRAAPATQCASASASQMPSIHRDKYITVFVNPTGRRAMLGAATPAFPVGSVIVKEKRSSPTAHSIELMTVMVKREAGYNPGGGDWEYAVVGPDRQVLEDGQLDRCQSCHAAQRGGGWVFRDQYMFAAGVR